MTWVVDASVAVKWFVEEARSVAARTVLASDEALIAPDLIIPECCNTAWKKVRRGDISKEQGAAMMQALPLSFERLVPSAQIASRALELAQRLNHPAYDCFYMALAESAEAMLVTDDDRVVELAKAARRGKLVKALATFEGRRK